MKKLALLALTLLLLGPSTILLGVGGSLLGGLITASRSGAGLGEGFNRAGCLASVLGAMALIFIGRALGVG